MKFYPPIPFSFFLSLLKTLLLIKSYAPSGGWGALPLWGMDGLIKKDVFKIFKLKNYRSLRRSAPHDNIAITTESKKTITLIRK
jgi:hypothetical protein